MPMMCPVLWSKGVSVDKCWTKIVTDLKIKGASNLLLGQETDINQIIIQMNV